jgi:hypothetical protein
VNWRRVASLAMAIMATMLATAPAQAAGPTVLDPSKPHYGRTYAQWSAAWWQWALSIPVHTLSGTVNHPLVDTTGAKCGVGQEEQQGQNGGEFGQVWFLGGAFFPTGTPAQTKIVRHCTVPRDKALFFTPLNVECSTLEGNGSTKAELLACAQSAVDQAGRVTADIAVDSKTPRSIPVFRVQSPLFTYTLPHTPQPDDILSFIGEGPFPPGSSSRSVGDGYYTMLAPLSPGNYTLHFYGEIPNFKFSLDVTYILTVK